METKIKQPNGDMYTDMSGEDNPCIQCGACCEHFRVSFYQGELKSLGGTVDDSFVIPINHFLVAMKGTEYGGGKCTALSTEGGEKKCSIYENRPSVCRKYHVWDENGNPNPKCQELRQKRGLELLKNKVI